MARSTLRIVALCALLGVAKLAAAGASLSGTIPLQRNAEPVSEGGLWTPSALVLGAAVAAGAYVAWRRTAASSGTRAGGRAEPVLARISSQALTPQASVHAVRWNGEEYLLACTAQQVTLIARRAVGGVPEEVR